LLNVLWRTIDAGGGGGTQGFFVIGRVSILATRGLEM
jgi:hypothetical protein